MAIQIIDGFQVNVSSPIDNRIVASGSAARNAIPYKYEGLRVYDLSDNVPYVFYNNAWISENQSGVSGTGTAFYFPRFSSSNVLTNSFLYQDGDVLKTDDVGSGVDLIQLDAWYGSVTAQSFWGDGNQITNINGNNLQIGSTPINKLVNGSTGWILSGGAGSPIWTNPTQISVGTSSVANTIVVNNNTSNATNYLAFVGNTSGNNALRAASNLSYNPATGLLSVGSMSVVRINSSGGSLPSSIGSSIYHANFTSTSTNANRLEINTLRTTAGSSWLTSASRIQAMVDAEYMGYIQFNGTGNETGISFGTGYMSTDNYSNNYEKMRIDISGRVMIGRGTQSSLSTGCLLHLKSNSDLYDGLVHQSFNESHTIFEFRNNSGVLRGRIVGNGSSGVLYNTTSDKRLKKDIEVMPSMYDKIKSLKPSKFKWKSDEKEEFGFIAQEVFNVFPNFRGELSYSDVNSPDFDIENPLTKEGTEHYYGLDYGRFTPYLTKALQETMEKLETLTNKIKNASSLEDLKNSL